jgi:hypothetical protein
MVTLQRLHLTDVCNAGRMLRRVRKATRETPRWPRIGKICPEPSKRPIIPIAMASLFQSFEALSNRRTEFVKGVGAAVVNSVKIRKHVSKPFEVMLNVCEFHPLQYVIIKRPRLTSDAGNELLFNGAIKVIIPSSRMLGNGSSGLTAHANDTVVTSTYKA